MAQQQASPGPDVRRLITLSTLLFLIDPVRGKPTVHNIDKHVDHGAWEYQNAQKKFLDSFALICSTSRKGGKTASAVCLEQGSRGRTLRLARNLETAQDELDRIKHVLSDLVDVARLGCVEPRVKEMILRKIVDLNIDKIQDILQRLRRNEVQKDIKRGLLMLEQENTPLEGDLTKFKEWIGKLQALVSLPSDADSLLLMPHIKWASKARWVYSKQIESLFPPKDNLPKWTMNIFKIGRYYTATTALIKYALKDREAFNSICVEVIKASDQEPFFPRNKNPLSVLLKSLNKYGTDRTHVLSELSRIWDTRDPEAHFRNKCRHDLTVHAEMQILSFYDTNQELSPRLRYMGTSKKACYLCNTFLSLHPLKMTVSACHQKIYPQWMPGWCPGNMTRKYVEIFDQMNKILAQEASRDLKTRLGLRRPFNLDSTAGPSLTYLGSGFP